MTNATATASRPWLIGLLLLAAVLGLMRETVGEMVAIWSRSGTFTHAFMVPPLAAWLAWRRREVLALTPRAPVPWLLLPLALACTVWLLGDLAAVGVVSQFALVGLIVLSVPALWGWAVARVLVFPLAFLFFAVPFGEFTQPVLMKGTADFTVAALRASGVPVYREGLDFVIPSGHWSVVEACSGVRYLVASVMVGTLFAYLNFRRWHRRLMFVAVAIAVPIVANWLRAYLIVMIGHLSGNQLAVGVDHLLYGWLFFGVVVSLMFLIGTRWSEREDRPAAMPVAPPLSPPRAAWPAAWPMAAAIAALVAATQAWSWRLDHREPAAPPQLSLPTPLGAWRTGEEAQPWQPLHADASTVAQAAYVGPSQRPVWLWVAYVRDPGHDRKLVSSVHRVAGDPAAGWQERRPPGPQRLRPDGSWPEVQVHDLSERAPLGVSAARGLRVWRVYWTGGTGGTGGRWTASDARAALQLALARGAGARVDGAAVLLATPAGVDADGALAEFARLHGPALELALQQSRDTR